MGGASPDSVSAVRNAVVGDNGAVVADGVAAAAPVPVPPLLPEPAGASADSSAGGSDAVEASAALRPVAVADDSAPAASAPAPGRVIANQAPKATRTAATAPTMTSRS